MIKKKNLLSILFLIPFLLTATQAFASSFYIIMHVDANGQNDIYKQITSAAPLYKPGADNYHVSLARIDNVDPNKAKELKATLVAAAKNIGNPVIPTSDLVAERYLSGGRTPTKCPIVLAVKGQSEQTFRAMNNAIFNALIKYNKGNKVKKGVNWIDAEFTTEYVPHITAADTKYIDGQNPNNKAMDRDQVIAALNKKIANANFQIQVFMK